MDESNALMWATGIDNSGLERDKEKAVQIFKSLASDVDSQIKVIEKYIDRLKMKGNFKFQNPVDQSMISSIKRQMDELGNTINKEIQNLSSFSRHYDEAMNHINKSAAKIPNIPASDPLGPTVERVKTRVKEADSQLSFMTRIFKRGIAYLAVYGSINWAENFAKQVILTKGQFDQLEVVITKFVGNAKAAKRLIDDVSSFAVKSPFNLLDITNSTRQLLAFGVQSKDVMHTLHLLSDLAAGSGQRIEDITRLYGTSMTRGRVYSREMYQFASRGIPIWQAMSKTMGVSTEELQKMITKGKIGFKELQISLEGLAGVGGKYYGVSDTIAATTYGRLSNLEDKWKVALRGIGNANEGIINGGIEMTSTLIENWSTVADTIKGVVLAVGAYKASQIAVSAANGVRQTTYAGTYAKGAISSGMVSGEFRENAAKAGLIEGSVAYQRELEKEMALQIMKAKVAVDAAKTELAGNEQLLESKEQEIIAINESIAAKKLEMESALASGETQGGEAIQTELNTAQTQLNTAEDEKNVIAKNIKNSTTKLGTAETELNTVQTTINTVEENANTKSKEAGAIATTLLGKAWKGLTEFMSANAYSLAIAGIAGLVYVLYKLYQRVQENNNIAKKWVDQEKAIYDQEQKNIDSGNTLINVMSNVGTTMYARIEALRKLKKEYPSLFKNMSTEVALSKSIAYWTEKIQQAEENRTKNKIKNSYKSAQSELNEAKAALISAQKNYQQSSGDYVSGATTGGQASAFAELAAAKQRVKNAEEMVKATKKSVKEVNETDKQTNEATKKQIHDQAYYTKLKQDAYDKRMKLDASQYHSPQWYKYYNEELKYSDILNTRFGSASKIEKTGESAEKKAEREKLARESFLSQVNHRKQQIKSNQKEISDYEANAEELRKQAFTDTMEKGYLHDKQVIEDEYNKKIIDISAEQDKVVKLLQQNEKLEWENKPKNTRGVYKPTISNWEDVPSSQRVGVETTLKAANDVKIAKEKALERDLLIQYDDYEQQKEEIARKHEQTRQDLTDVRSRYQEGSKEYNDITIKLAENEKRKVLEQYKLSFAQQKESPVYQLMSEDASKVSEEGLITLMDILKKYKKAAVDAYDPTSVKEWSDEIKRASDQLIKLDPIKALKKANDDLISANDELKKSDAELVAAQNEYNDASRVAIELADRKKNIESQLSGTTNFPITTGTGEDIVPYAPKTKSKNQWSKSDVNITRELANVTNLASRADDKLSNASKNLMQVQNKHAVATSNVTNATNTQKEATKGILDEIGKVSTSLSDVGKSMGGVAGNVVSLIGDIGSTVASTITAFETADKMVSGLAKTMETASVILMAISAAITIITKIASLFNSESSTDKERESLIKLNKVLSETSDLYKEILATQAGIAAKQTGEEYVNTLNKEIANSRQAAIDKSLHRSSNAHSVGYRETRDISNINASNFEKMFGLGATSSIWDAMTKDLGVKVKDVYDILNLSTDNLAKLKRDFPEVWAQLNDDVQNSLNDVISKAKEVTDAVNEINKAVTGIDFDTMKDGMDDFLLSTNTTMTDISNNFEDTMRKSILNLVKTNFLTSEMQKWYNNFASDLSGDNQLSQTEIADLKKQYEDIYKQTQDKIDNLLNIADISKTDTNSNTIKSSFQSMSEDQANVLSAQFGSLRINMSDLVTLNEDYVIKFELMAQDVSKIREYTALLADIKSTLADIKSKGVKML